MLAVSRRVARRTRWLRRRAPNLHCVGLHHFLPHGRFGSRTFDRQTGAEKRKSAENEEDEANKIDENEFKDEVLKVNVKDYYFSNVVARSSKTMIECNNSKIHLKSTGTEG